MSWRSVRRWRMGWSIGWCCLRVSSASNQKLCRDGRSARSSRVAVSLHRRFKTLLPRNFGRCRCRRSAGQCCPSTFLTTLLLLYDNTQPFVGSCQWLDETASKSRHKPLSHMVKRHISTPMDLPSDGLRQLLGTDFRRGSIKLPLTASSNLTSSSSLSSFTLLHVSGRSHDFGSDFMG